jgi:hypothetical protein
MAPDTSYCGRIWTILEEKPLLISIRTWQRESQLASGTELKSEASVCCINQTFRSPFSYVHAKLPFTSLTIPSPYISTKSRYWNIVKGCYWKQHEGRKKPYKNDQWGGGGTKHLFMLLNSWMVRIYQMISYRIKDKHHVQCIWNLSEPPRRVGKKLCLATPRSQKQRQA